MHAILISLGTDGDVIPYLGLGTRLRARGYPVTLLAPEPYRASAGRLGFDFRPLVSGEEMHALLADPDFWHPLRSALAGVRMGAGLIPRQYELLAELAAAPDAVLVANAGVLAARLVQEKRGRPMVTLLLQPWTIPSVSVPPVMPAGLTLPRGMPGQVGRFYWRLVNATGDLLVGRHVNRARAQLGMNPIRCFFDWWLSPERVIGMFPDWFGPPQDDWPPQMRLAGFPLYDGVHGGLPADVRDFCRAGEPPIAFTLGTGMMHAARFFRTAVAACQALGTRALLLTKYPHQVPSRLPPSVRHYTFAPFLELLPHCAAVVHHGGAGTVAKALATGTPQVIVPLAWDQPDNAARVERLGAGVSLPPRSRSRAGLAKALRRMLTPEARARCRAVAERFGEIDALAVAAGLVEEIAA